MVNVVLGAPYERIIAKAIKEGYAGNQTEVIRQALRVYDGKLEEECLVSKAVEEEMRGIRSGKTKTHPAGEVYARAGLK
ncbi:MAG: hypothetical protein WC607_03655 [Candidatus Micrarchaeia archaeon]